jgi:4-aminobutyrate aminotransferase-like enzyme/Ser/Thr protein kinase RdoA (MazF antagonist)
MTTAPSEVFTEPAPDFSLGTLAAALHEHWSTTEPRLRRLDSERDLNVLVDDRFVLKISNPAEASAIVAMEVEALAHVRAADPGLPVPAVIAANTGATIVRLRDDSGRDCLARLVTLLPGAQLEGTPIDPALAAQIGAVAGRTSVALQGFFHPAAGRILLWDIRRLPHVLADSGVHEGQLATLAERVAPALAATATLPSGVQHGDVTLTNLLAEAGTVVGVIDFGDMHHTAAVCDLAATLTSVLRSATDNHWQLSEAVLRGYQRHRLLTIDELAILGELVIARVLTTLAVSATRRDRHSDNHRYITQYDDNSTRLLDVLSSLGPDEIADKLQRLAGNRSAAACDLADRRAAAMGGRLSPLFYSKPLEIVRGEGPWLFSSDGTRYLDAYNNVAVVGHAHPAVTNAVSAQLARLNTHSRYLHPSIVELAERILATMPPELDTCLFTTSGTEANELAWRLATEYTGATGAIIAEHAYHGSSKWMADLSSNEWPPGHHPQHVATFAAPHGPAANLTEATAVHRITQAASTLDSAALVLADSQFTSEGILDTPGEFAAGLVKGAHQAGALYLADEVQSGYGRSGPQLWRFALAGITPDLVTLGKPMGAGYPIGAVITRREIAGALAERYEYFSTFAATPAAAAAGHAVLDILELTGLPEQAVQVGTYLRRQLTDLAAQHPMLGEVRGNGLLAGVDLHTDTVENPRALARSVLDRLVGCGVLAGVTGPHGNVLKIRPPLVWTSDHVDVFIDRLARTLTDTNRV